MKKGVVIGVIGFLFLACSLSFSAITKTLIDFTVFEQNMKTVVQKDRDVHSQQVADKPHLELTNYGYPAFQFSESSYDMTNWRVVLTSSANTIKNNVYSYCKNVKSERFKGNVLGARIHFIEGRFLSWALIKSPYDFFAYYDDGSYVNDGANKEENGLVMGVLVNVGQIKSISSWVYGLNYQMQFGVRIKDRTESPCDYFMGSLYFDGWRKLVWLNSEYADNIQDRVIQRLPLYPKSFPYIVFESFIIWKPETEMGGDFVVYFKDCTVEFDKAIVRETLDIDDEGEWGILAKERLDKKIFDMRNIGEKVYLYEQEVRRQQAQANEAGITK